MKKMIFFKGWAWSVLLSFSLVSGQSLAAQGLEAAQESVLSEEMIKVRSYVPMNAVIAHRGAPYWAPESTEAAYRFARNVGADYLEADLQLTKDQVVVIVHDDNIYAKSDVHQKFPDRNRGSVEKPRYVVGDFTLNELLTLDMGSWFNQHEGHKAQARTSFVDQKILTLRDLLKIAEGYRILRNEDGTVKEYVMDEKDSGHRPGIYLETKRPALNPGIEGLLFDELNAYGWNILTSPAVDTAFYKDGRVNIGNTRGKLVLQSFSRNSLALLQAITKGQIPTCHLLWYDPKDESGDSLPALDPTTYRHYQDIALSLGAQFIGPSIQASIAEGSETAHVYRDLLTEEKAEQNRAAKLFVHPYTFDDQATMQRYYERCEGMFTNLPDLTARFYAERGLRAQELINTLSAEEVLDQLGYPVGN